MKRIAHIGIRVMSILAIAAAGAVFADDLEITRSTIDGGGAMHSTGGDFELSGTIGQPDAGTMSGDEFDLTGGFWFEEPPTDCNSTGGVNLLDYDGFEACLDGPDTDTREGCECYDVNKSNTVDMVDFAAAQQNFSG